MKQLLFLLFLPISIMAQKNYPHLLEQYMQDQTTNGGFSGSVLIIRNNKVLLKAGYGLADREWKIPNGAGVRYRLGSVSKQFTAACILRLVEEGRLSLDDKLTKFFPDYPKGDSVTIRMLLNHTSGIFNYSNADAFLKNLRLVWSKDSIIGIFKNRPYYFSPGAAMRYSNSNFFLLGYIVEKVSGQSLGDYLQQHFLARLGMKNTGVDEDDSIVPHRARGYKMEGGKILNCDYFWTGWAFGGGQLYSTIDDLYTWEKAYDKNIVLSDSSRKMMFTAGRDNYGFGIAIGSFNGHKWIGHTGDTHGFDTYVSRFVDDDAYIIILSNDQANVKMMAIDICHILFDDPGLKGTLTKQLASVQIDQERKKIQWQLNYLQSLQPGDTEDATILRQYTGVFGYTLQFFINGNALFCREDERGGEIFRAKHIRGRLYNIDENLQVEFDKIVDGKATGIKMFRNDGNDGYWTATPSRM